jgi:hypothetical protein
LKYQKEIILKVFGYILELNSIQIKKYRLNTEALIRSRILSLIILMLVLIFVFTQCTKKVDVEGEKNAITDLLEQHWSSWEHLK